MDEYRVVTTEFQRAAKALRNADKIIQKEITASIRRVAKPIGQDVMVTGAAGLPLRGGLAYSVAGGRVSVNISTMRAGISLGKHAYKPMNEGVVRHPVFGRKKTEWKQQTIRRGLFTSPFEASAGRLQKEVLDGMTKALDQIKADAS
jgi:hypothetical protein